MILIDAYSQIFRGFHAIANLSDSRGEPTNAIFALAKLLLRIHQEYRDELGAAVFDCGRVQFRLALNPAYKGTRPPMPEALKKQMPEVRRLFGLFGWPELSEPEYEADDLIAALAVHSGEPVRIISSDKDLAQLIDSRVTMLVPAFKGGFEVRSAEKVREKFGVTPGQIVDYLALLGDASDNIPGVPGVGAKTAAKLLEELGGLANFFADPAILTNEKLRAKLLENRELLERNIALIRLRRELPEKFTGEGILIRREPDWARLAEFCREHDLASILRELEKLQEVPAAPSGMATESKPADTWVQDELF